MKRIVFLLDDFQLQSPGQQLLDRFLIGYNRDGQFRQASSKVAVVFPDAQSNGLIAERVANLGLDVVSSLETALNTADAALVIPGSKEAKPKLPLNLERAVRNLPSRAIAYLDGSFQMGSSDLTRLFDLAKKQNVDLAASTPAAHLFPIPLRPVFAPTSISKALVITQGAFPSAELDALYGVSSYFLGQLAGMAPAAVNAVAQTRLWNTAYSAEWRPLLAAAVSRSNTIQGDPERDGRTQDIVGQHLLEKLAPQARGWLLHLRSGLELMILALDGALNDFNFAVSDRRKIYSAQLFRAPAPLEDHYSNMAGWLEDVIDGKLPAETSMLETIAFRRIIEQLESQNNNQ